MNTALNPDILPQFQRADAHRTQMLDLFCAVTNDCVNKLLEPVHVAVHNYDFYAADGEWRVVVQFQGADSAAVDALADCYWLAPDDGETPGYQRSGRVVINGRPGTVTAYTSRPAVDQ